MNSLKFYTENYTITYEKKSQNWIIHPPPPPPPQSISQVEELKENEDLTPLHSATTPHNHPSCSSYYDMCMAQYHHKPDSTERAPLAELHYSDTTIC